MARYRVKELSYIGERLVEAGEIVEIDNEAMQPGANLEPLEGRPPRRPQTAAAATD